MDLLVHLGCEELMGQWVLLGNLVQWAKGEQLGCLVYQELKEILVQEVQKEAQVFKAREERPANLADQVNLARWVHQERMETMERKEVLEFQVLLDLQDFLDPEANLDLMVALDLRVAKEWQGNLGKWV